MVDPSETVTPPPAVLAVYAPLTRTDVPGLCARLLALLHADRADPFPCDVSALIHPDLAAIEALARLQLTARGVGRRIRLHGTSGELRDLLTLTGLDEIVPTGPGSGRLLGVECRREAEQREQVRDVEERVEADDLPL
ncbi:STAS domain-containing protein [Embleya sp. NBC_00888]|uniref:STAS domain-containing protein n=1 Tax=Embleya sp. NBC_00888 TaxID=2975960 RepID=UPI003868FED7|nr:STAS domain-containing protein [Embleya sp. NBC_00888]